MDVETTKPTNTGAIQYRTRQFRLIATCAFLNVSHAAVCAEVVNVGNDNSASFSETGMDRSAERHSQMMPLRASSVLGQARRFGSVGTVSAPARLATRQVTLASMSRLRFDPTLTSMAAPASGTRRSLPVGELNREGIVRARTLQIRDGAFYLVGSYAEHEETPQLETPQFDGDFAVRD
jgi:hypothetical protein